LLALSYVPLPRALTYTYRSSFVIASSTLLVDSSASLPSPIPLRPVEQRTARTQAVKSRRNSSPAHHPPTSMAPLAPQHAEVGEHVGVFAEPTAGRVSGLSRRTVKKQGTKSSSWSEDRVCGVWRKMVKEKVKGTMRRLTWKEGMMEPGRCGSGGHRRLAVYWIGWLH
jgi:hypothetical protein